MDDESELIPAADALIEINRRWATGASYVALWRLIAQGSIPAQRVRGRWRIRRADLPLVAQAFGVRPAA